MYIFDRVVARVVETAVSWQPLRIQFDFYYAGKMMSFTEAIRVADKSFLEDRVAHLNTLYAEQRVGEEIELTSERSKLRGYQGGLCHIAMIHARPHFVLPLRSADAPTSPLMLDISSGRFDILQDEAWEHTLLREGTEEIGYISPHGKILPVFGLHELEGGFETALVKNVMDAYDRVPLAREMLSYNRQRVLRLFSCNDTYATVQVHMISGREPEIFSAGWGVLPYCSSIEFFQHLVLQIPRGTALLDLEWHDKQQCPLNRDMYLVATDTGNTQVWNAGFLRREAPLSILLDENKQHLEQLASQGKITPDMVLPVSPKTRAAVQQLPSAFKKNHNCSGLALLEKS